MIDAYKEEIYLLSINVLIIIIEKTLKFFNEIKIQLIKK